MTNGEKLKAVLNPRANQIRILGNWVEIEIQKLGINFSCGLDWWNTEYKEPTTKNDLALIHTWGLDEGIRCAMCINSIKSDRGCDGGCVVNNVMYKEVMDVIENHIVDTDKMVEPTTKNDLSSGLENVSPIIDWNKCHTSEQLNSIATTKNDLGVDCISRADVLNHLANIAKVKAKSDAQKSLMGRCMFMVENIPSITPQEPRWIPVSERLPEERLGVLVWCPTRKNIYCACYEEKQWWIFGAYWEKVTEEIVAWRPLPIKPYSEAKE